jgi:hypothetical protein
MEQLIKIYFRMGWRIYFYKYRVDYVFTKMKFIFVEICKNKSREELVIFCDGLFQIEPYQTPRTTQVKKH